MSANILEKLEEKIDHSIETIELLSLQLEESEERNAKLAAENEVLRRKQISWEQNLSQMVQKLDLASQNNNEIEKTVSESEIA